MQNRKYISLISLFVLLLSPELFADMADKVSLSGDLRYRHESKEEGVEDANHRQRIRARVKAAGQVNKDTKIVFRLATGGGGVTSTNQSLGDAGSNKAFDLDQAYVNYTATEALTIRAGKMSNPLYRPAKSQLIWDGDVTPEGIALSFDCKCDESKKYFARLAGFWLEDRGVSGGGNDLADAGITAAQLGGSWSLGAVDLTAGASYYEFNNLKGRASIDPGASMKGNSDTLVAGSYDNDYKVTEGFLEVGGKVSNIPVAIFLDYITNADPSEDNTGSSIGLKIGKAKSAGTFGFQYEVRQLEKDATLGVLVDGDFAGGGTDGKGSIISLKYAMANNSSAKITYYDNEEGIDTDTDYNLIHADFIWKF